MSQVTKPIMLDETGKELIGVLRQQNALISAMARSSVNAVASSWKDIHDIVREGLAPEIFHIGDQFIVSWRDVAANKVYELPLDIVHFGNATLKGGTVVPAMYLQFHYGTPFGVSFDWKEGVAPTETTFKKGLFYYEKSSENSYRLLVEGVDYSVGGEIPNSMELLCSAIGDPTGRICSSGYNRWSCSAVRQFLNSSKGVGEWWEAQHIGDTRPQTADTKAGLMSGFDADFLSCLKPIRNITCVERITNNDNIVDETFDTFFLPSVDQFFAYNTSPLHAQEGEYFDYWKLAVGKNVPDKSASSAHIIYDLNGAVQVHRTRSANVTYTDFVSGLSITGTVGNTTAHQETRVLPACAIC